jgi:DNA-binding transcriptional regulator YiaG
MATQTTTAPWKLQLGSLEFRATLTAIVHEKFGPGIPLPEIRRFDEAVVRWMLAHPKDCSGEGQTLRVFRAVAHLKPAELADLLGVSPELVAQWEKGAVRYDRATWAVVASLAADALAGVTTTRDRLVEGRRVEPAVVDIGTIAPWSG